MDEKKFTLSDNEKFACLAFEGVNVDSNVPTSVYLGNNSWILQEPPFTVDDQWREWLGTLNIEHLSKSSFIVISKMKSEKPEIFDDENKYLEQLVHAIWYSILMDGMPNVSGGLLVTGAMRNHNLDVRSAGKANRYVRPHLVMPQGISLNTIEQSSVLASNILELFSQKGAFIRVKKGWHAWHSGLLEEKADIRLHRFVRMIEAMIKPRIGRSSRDFVHRSKFFVDYPNSDTMLDEIYGLRSSVEHLNDWQQSLLDYPESEREETASLRAYQTEVIANFVLKKLLLSQDLKNNFIDDAKIENFWKQEDHMKIQLLGEKCDLKFTCDSNFKPY